MTRKDFPANNLQEFIAYGKAHPGELKYGSAGAGSAIHLGCVLFNAAAGIDAIHMPYRGGAPAMQDMIAGRIDYGCNIITSAYPQVRDQVVKSLALLSATRAPLLPNLATAQEQGMAEFDAGSWNIVFLPKGTPQPIVRKLNAAMSEAMDSARHRKAAARHRHRHSAEGPPHPGLCRELRRAGDQEIRRPDQGQRHRYRISGIPARHSAA